MTLKAPASLEDTDALPLVLEDFTYAAGEHLFQFPRGRRTVVRVVDTDNRPVPGVGLSVQGGRRSFRTGTDGRAVLTQLRPGTALVKVYYPHRLDAGKTAEIDADLEENVIRVRPIQR